MEKYQRTNFISMAAEGGLYQIAAKFWDTSTVVPLFLAAYAGSMTVVGLASTLSMCASVVMAFLFGMYAWRIKDLTRFQFYVLLLRGLPFLLAPIVIWTPSPSVAVIAFLVIYTIFNGSTGIIGVSWWDIMGRTIPQENRGRLIGLQQIGAGIGGLVTGVAIKAILGSQRIGDPLRFGILFAGVGLFGLLSALVMARVKDPHRKPGEPTGSPLRYMGQFRKLLSANAEYRRALLLQAAHYVLFYTIPYLIVFEKEHFALNDGQVSTLVFLQIIGTLLGGLLWGELSKRRGNTGVIRVTLTVSLLLMLTVIGCSFINNPLAAPMGILSGISLAAGACQMAFLYNRNYLIDITDEENRAVYFVMNSTLLFPFSFISVICGAVADAFGFRPVFILGALATLVCLVVSKGLLSTDQLPAWQEELKKRYALVGQRLHGQKGSLGMN
ncbi:MAG: MFS transporter [Clostridia bacterium]|jgi:MFS family permease